MDREHLFRVLILILALGIYLIRIWARACRNSHPTAGTSRTLSTGVMCVWAASLGAYSFGFGWFDAHLSLPEYVRWIGAGCMAVSLPLSMWTWVFNRIADGFMSHISSGMAAAHLGDGSDYPILSPACMSFFVCDVGAVMLSANAWVLLTSIAAFAAMGVRVTTTEEARRYA